MKLPSDYRLLGTLNLAARNLILQIGISSLLMLIVSIFLFARIGTLIRSDSDILGSIQQLIDAYDANLAILFFASLAVLAIMTCLHEAIHGLFIRVFTGKRPRFGFKIYPYAALPPDTFCNT